MNRALSIAVSLLCPGFCAAQSLTPGQALARYLAGPRNRQSECSDRSFAVQIDAALPKLRRRGSMTGLKVVTRTGQILYRGLQFTGDNLVKTAVIARFLSNDMEARGREPDAGVTPQNYSFSYGKTAAYNGLIAYVFLLRPKRKRAGFFRGELWLEANSGVPLRLWGDSIKSPSIFVRNLRFVQDYQELERCSQPLRLLVTVQTRLAGPVQLAMWLHSVDGRQAESR